MSDPDNWDVRHVGVVSTGGRGGCVFWSRLARQHPDLATRVQRERVESRDPADDRLLYEANTAFPLLADARPDKALRLVTALARHFPLGRIALEPLYRRLEGAATWIPG